MKIIGHRGARGLVYENTWQSIEAAIEHGVDEVEFDVRVTTDGVPVLIHDPTFTDGSGLYVVKQTSFDRLSYVNQALLTLDEVFTKLHSHQVPLVIEIKPYVDAEPVIDVIGHHLQKGWKPENILVASFSQSILLDVHQALPEITVVVNERWSGVRGSYRARKLHTKRITMNQRWLWSGFIRQVAKSGYQLSAYTLNDITKARRWEKAGLYGVITDFPDRFTGK